MKIAVCAKVVPEQARRIDPETKRLDRSGEQTLNPFDANAVEEALRLKGDDAGAEVVLVSLGPERSLDALRKALAMGADRVVLVADEAAAGSDLVASSYALARALDREQADLVLFGQQANDSDGAVGWAAGVRAPGSTRAVSRRHVARRSGSMTTARARRRSSSSCSSGRRCEHARLPRAPRGRAAEGLAGRARQGGSARRRRLGVDRRL